LRIDLNLSNAAARSLLTGEAPAAVARIDADETKPRCRAKRHQPDAKHLARLRRNRSGM